LFAPFGVLIPLLTQFLIRFLYTGPQYTAWLNVNHHAAPAAILFPIVCIYAAEKIVRLKKLREKNILIILSIILISTTVFQDILLKAPIHSIFKKSLYETQEWMRNNDLILEKIQETDAKIPIAAQNSLFPHLSQREKVYLLPEIKDAQYLVVDLHDGPNKYAPLMYFQMKDLVYNLLISKKYSIYDQKGEAMILKLN